MYKTIAMILAGGQGSRLSILADHRAKPAVPFGGMYRIIDFTMSNVMHSNIPVVGILTQYKPYSLMDHIATGAAWGFRGRKHFAKILPPYVGEADSDWYAGTADAVYQNLSFIERFDPEYVVVLSGDHIYKMDFNRLLEFHIEKGAEVTIAMQKVPFEDVYRFGVAVVDEDQRMTDFIEKSPDAPSNLASLGIYIFNRSFLDDILVEDAADSSSSHDFGKNIIPRIMKDHRVYCFIFDGYWRDVGTIEAYWTTHQEALESGSGLNMADWGVRTNMNLENLCNLMPSKILPGARVRNSIISQGCVIEGEVTGSILSPGVFVGKGSRVEKSVIMNDSRVEQGTIVSHAILDKDTHIGKGCRVGVGEPAENRLTPHLLSCGLTVFGKNAVLPARGSVGKNCIIHPGVGEEDYKTRDIPSGETVKSAVRQRRKRK